MSRLTPQAAAALLRDQDNLLILTHRRPDGDTTGCAAALCLALRQLGRTAFLLRNPEMKELFRQTNICLDELDGLLARGSAIYAG